MSFIFRSDLTSPDNNAATALYDFESPINHVDDEGGEDCELPEELARLLKQESKIIQPHQEAVDIINLGSDEEKREVRVGASLRADSRVG